jgi:hypothetical protein
LLTASPTPMWTPSFNSYGTRTGRTFKHDVWLCAEMIRILRNSFRNIITCVNLWLVYIREKERERTNFFICCIWENHIGANLSVLLLIPFWDERENACVWVWLRYMFSVQFQMAVDYSYLHGMHFVHSCVISACVCEWLSLKCLHPCASEAFSYIVWVGVYLTRSYFSNRPL